MTAEIVDLDKYRKEKISLPNKPPNGMPETRNETSEGEPVGARLGEFREKDSGEPA